MDGNDKNKRNARQTLSNIAKRTVETMKYKILFPTVEKDVTNRSHRFNNYDGTTDLPFLKG